MSTTTMDASSIPTTRTVEQKLVTKPVAHVAYFIIGVLLVAAIGIAWTSSKTLVEVQPVLKAYYAEHHTVASTTVDTQPAASVSK